MKNAKIIWYVKIIVGIVLIFFLYRKINQRNEVINAFQSAALVNIIFCMILYIPNFFVQFLKWRFVIRSRFPDIKNSVVIQSLLFGVTLGFVTPGNLGDLARALYINKYDRVVVTGLNLIDKLSGLIVFISIGIVALNYLIITKFNWTDLVLLPFNILSLLVLLLIWLLALNPHIVKSGVLKINWKSTIRMKVEHFISCLDGISRAHSLRILSYAFLWFIVILLQYHVLILAFENSSFMNSFWSVGATLFTKILLPISFGDLGIREGAAVYFYSLFGVAQSTAFNAALLIFVINFILPALVGSYFVFKLHWELNSKK